MKKFRHIIWGFGLTGILYSNSGFSQGYRLFDKQWIDENGKTIDCVETYTISGALYCRDKNGNVYSTQPPAKSYNPSSTSSRNNSNLGSDLLIGAGIVGGLLLLNELFKPRNKPTPSNSYTDYNYTPSTYGSEKKEEVIEKVPNFHDYFKSSSSGSKENFSDGTWWKDEKNGEDWKNSEWWKNSQQKKSEAEARARANSKELSDFVEKQAGYSPEAKVWFDKEYAKADAFYKEQCRINPDICDNIQEMDKLHKIIGYNAYQYAKEHTPAGSVITGTEKVSDKNWWNEQSEKSEKIFGQPEKGAPENSWYHGTTQWQKDVKTGIYVVGDNFTPLVNGIEKAMEFEEKGANGFWNEKIKEAEEYFNVKNGQMYIGPNKYNSASKYHQTVLVVNYESSKIMPGGEQARELDKKGDWWDE